MTEATEHTGMCTHTVTTAGSPAARSLQLAVRGLHAVNVCVCVCPHTLSLASMLDPSLNNDLLSEIEF